MAWTAIVGEICRAADQIEVEVGYFKDGVHQFNKMYRTSSAPPVDWLENTAKKTIERLEQLDITQISTGLIGEPEPPEPIDPGLVAFRQDLRRLDVILKLVQLGVLAPDHAKVVEFITRFRTELITYWSEI